MDDGTAGDARGLPRGWEPAPLRQVRLLGGLLGERQRVIVTDQSIFRPRFHGSGDMATGEAGMAIGQA